jgi:hypothetical protein
VLNWGEYFEYKLRQTGVIDCRMVDQLKRRFHEVSKGDGSISLADLIEVREKEKREHRRPQLGRRASTGGGIPQARRERRFSRFL